VVWLGLGGMSLWPEVCRTTFGSAPGWPHLLILDSMEPHAAHEVAAQIPLDKTLFLVASLSDTTPETLRLYRYFYAYVRQHVPDHVGNHFVAITEAGTPLAREACQRNFWRCFENPTDIDGWYMALSYFGLMPMALLGVDIAAVLERAHQMQVSCGPSVPAVANPGVSVGALLGIAARHGQNKVTFVLADSIKAFGAWMEQALAASTGKDEQGLVPVVGEPLGAPQMYSADRVFVSIRLAKHEDPTVKQRLTALEAAGHPVVCLTLPTALDLGAECLRWKLAAATAGALLGAPQAHKFNVEDTSIPDEIFGFARPQHAQALGNGQALAAKG
jgi:transaldolase/glucose-6-phosphate isomerase